MPSLLKLEPEQLHALDVARSAMDPTHERQRPGFIGMYDCIHSRSFHGCELPTSVLLLSNLFFAASNSRYRSVSRDIEATIGEAHCRARHACDM